MAKTYKKNYSKRYRVRRTPGAIPLYPSIYDSTLLYFNNSITYPVAAGAVPFNCVYVYTSGIQVTQNFIQLGQYFSRYRVEKMTVEFTMDQNAPIEEVSMAEIHDTKVVPLTYVTLDSYANVKTYSPQAGARCRCIWKMRPEITNDTIFRDFPAAAVNPPPNDNGGVIFLVRGSQAATVAWSSMYSINAKYKVRFTGRNGIAIV